MVGGLMVSQVLTLFTTPVVYLYLDRVSQWLSPNRHAGEKHLDQGAIEGGNPEVAEEITRKKPKVIAVQ